MIALTKMPLSASTDFRGIAVAATAIASGTTIHTAAASAVDGTGDEIVLYACNTDLSPHTLTLGWGGTATIGDNQNFTIAGGATVQVAAGMLLRNSLVLKAAADVTNVINLHGYILRSA